MSYPNVNKVQADKEKLIRELKARKETIEENINLLLEKSISIKILIRNLNRACGLFTDALSFELENVEVQSMLSAINSDYNNLERIRFDFEEHFEQTANDLEKLKSEIKFFEMNSLQNEEHLVKLENQNNSLYNEIEKMDSFLRSQLIVSHNKEVIYYF